jgi:pimeloyl-ACP methyl ester carboxylesterase
MIMMDYAFSKKAPLIMKENGFKDMMKSSAETIYLGFSACNQFSAIGSLERLSLPTLIIGGKDDLLTPPSYSEYLHKNIQDSELVLIEDAGHMVMIEKPEAVNRAIEKFVVNRYKERSENI